MFYFQRECFPKENMMSELRSKRWIEGTKKRVGKKNNIINEGKTLCKGTEAGIKLHQRYRWWWWWRDSYLNVVDKESKQ